MKTYDRTATAAKFLLGGIGTGNISLDQNARLCDFELWNKPNKGFRSPYTFFAVRTESQDGEVKAKALESQLAPPFDNSHGAHTWELGGLPRFRNSEMRGQYPFVNYKLTDSHMPVEAKLEAFTPLIPLATDDSSLPVAVLRYSIKNITNGPLTVSVAGSMSNLCGIKGFDAWTKPLYKDKGINKYVENRKLRGIHFSAENKTEAVLWYRKAAEQGFAPGQVALGSSYLEGEGVRQDKAEAVRWFRLAVEQGDALALLALGGCYLEGNGVRQDRAEAVRWLRLAAAQGDAVAQFDLGMCYERGIGVRQNGTEAVRWFRLAAAQGHDGSRQALERLGAR